MTENIGVNQRVVINPDGRQSIISAKLAMNPNFMAKHRLQLLEKYEGNPAPVAINIPQSKSNKAQEAKLMQDLGIDPEDLTSGNDTDATELNLDESATLAPAPKTPNQPKKGGK